MKLNIGDNRSFMKSLIQHNDAISIPKINDIDIAMKVILIEYNAFSFSVSVFKIDNALSNIFPNFGNAGTGFMYRIDKQMNKNRIMLKIPFLFIFLIIFFIFHLFLSAFYQKK